MPYKIQYNSVGPIISKGKFKKKWFFLGVIGLTVIAFTSNFWGYPWLEKIILPNGNSIIESLEVAVSQLQEGNTISDAVTAFCRDVIFHGG